MPRRIVRLAAPAGLALATVLFLTDGVDEAAGQPAEVEPGANVATAAPASEIDPRAVAPAEAARSRPVGSRSQVIRQVLPASVRISLAVDGSVLRVASGVIVGFHERAEGRVGYVMTNAHVVEVDDPARARVEVIVDGKGKSRTFPARVLARGEVPEMDLALLEVPGLVGEAARLVDDADLELGEEVVAVGAPFGRGLSVSSGIVSQLEWDEAGAALGFKTDAPIGYGASGGGIFRVPDGKLLAVIEGYRTAKISLPMADRNYSFDVPMPGETFAAPAAKIRRFLRANRMEWVIAGAKQAEAERPKRSPEARAGR